MRVSLSQSPIASPARAHAPSVRLGSRAARFTGVAPALRTARPSASARVAAPARAMATGVAVTEVPTKPIDGQKTGTSGLRKKAKEFSSGNYLAGPRPRCGWRNTELPARSRGLACAACVADRVAPPPPPPSFTRAAQANWVQSLFNALPTEQLVGSTMVLGGDGRWFNKEAAQIIIKLAAGNGVKKIFVGRNGYLCTPAASAVIRARKAFGGFIMSASHNPGGPDNDWGIKFNYSSGEPAPESLTDKIYGFTQSVSVLKVADTPDVDLTRDGVTRFGEFEVEVIDPVGDYLALFKASNGRHAG